MSLLQVTRDDDDDDDDDDDEEDIEEDKNTEESASERQSLADKYDEFLVKKHINDYFAQSHRSAEEEEEVFDRHERAGKSPAVSGKLFVVVVRQLPGRLCWCSILWAYRVAKKCRL